MNPITSYPGLREQVKQVLLLGRARIEQEKVRTYWETGRLIHTHILANNSRTAVYGKQVMIRLAKDLNIGETLLRRCSQFYQTFKKIPATWHESLPPLTWSHYRTLISIENPETREELVSRAVKQDWCARDLQAEVKRRNKNFYDVLIMASIIEAEVPADQDRPIVAQILWARLSAGIPLQSDATLNYLLPTKTARLSLKELAIDSPYNSYKYKNYKFVRSENLDRIIEFGSDRNIDFVGNKVSFDSFSSKMDLRIYTEFGLTPNQFTYCCDGYYLPKICGVQIERQQTKAGTLQVDKADDKVLMVVYDSTKMRTVIADVKKFEDDPRNCLLRVYLMLLK